ncbi:hypothetical protein N8987_01815 [Crocinitomix sp.]|nr:hypothetical protein [Crocinitomix sp.]
MKRLLIYFSAILLMMSCSKKIERRFPLGNYTLSILNPKNIGSDSTYLLPDSTLMLQVVASQNDSIVAQQFRIDSEAETIFAEETSTLYISRRKEMLGTIKTISNEPIMLYEGLITKRDKNDFIITGKVSFHKYLELEYQNLMADISGDFIFEKQ